MTPTYTRSTVKSKLNTLKKAVDAVIKANKSWLLALEEFLNDSNASAAISVITSNLPPNVKNLPDQALRLALDELTLLQLADRKLDGKVSPLEPTPDNLAMAIVESEAYLVVTDQAFEVLKAICKAIPQNIGAVGIEPASADSARTSLRTQVATLLADKTVTLPPLEPDGTELLLGKGLGPGVHKFLSLMLQAGASEIAIQQTQTLLSGGHLTLSNSQINALTDSWAQAVTQATDNLANSTPPFTVADLFGVHTTLETLYDRLETNVTRTDVDIVSPEI